MLPPGPRCRSLYLLAAALAAALAWSWHTQIDLSFMAIGMARPTTNLIYVASAVTGSVLEAPARAGAAVHAGDLLLQIDSSAIDRQRAALQSRLRLARGQRDSRQRLLESAAVLDRRLLALEQSRWEADLQAAQDGWKEARREWRRAKALSGEGLLPRQTADAARDAMRRAAAELDRANIAALDAHRLEREHQRAAQAVELAALDANLAALTAELDQLELEARHYRVTAPVSGIITAAAPLHPAARVTAGTLIATIQPGRQLQLESWIPPAYRSRIHEGQPVRVRPASGLSGGDAGFDATVISISPDVQTSIAGPAYRVVVAPRPGAALQLGAAFELHFVAGRERLLRVLFDRLRQNRTSPAPRLHGVPDSAERPAVLRSP